MPFEAFTREFVRTTEPKVTITNLGRFSINNGSTSMLKKNGPVGFVILLWDKDTDRIAIRPAKTGERGAYPLKAYGPKGRSGTGFSAVTFLKFINYDWSETRSYPVELVENMLVIKIPHEHLTGKYQPIGARINIPQQEKVQKKS